MRAVRETSMSRRKKQSEICVLGIVTCGICEVGQRDQLEEGLYSVQIWDSDSGVKEVGLEIWDAKLS